VLLPLKIRSSLLLISLIVTIILNIVICTEAESTQLNQSVLVVLVEFSDVTHTYSATSLDKLFFSANTKSVLNFYNKISSGNFTINRATDDYPILNNNDGIIGWINLEQNHPNCMNFSNTPCYQSLVTTAFQAIGPYIDLAKFDTNIDGIISRDELSVIFVIAGYELAAHDFESSITGPFVYAHQYVLDTPVILNEKQISHYALFGEKHDDHQATIGIIVHELGHLMLRLPDLYDITKTSKGAGPFDFMSSGSWGQANSDLYAGETPVYPSAWTSIYANFLSPFTITSDQANIQLSERSNTNALFIKVNTSNSNEYFALENRQLNDYDIGLQKWLNTDDTKGAIAIWHIDESLLSTCISANDCNNNASHKLVDLEEADGIQDLDTSAGQATLIDLYYLGNNSIFNNDTNPNSILYSGSFSNIAVVNVSSQSNVMSLDVVTNTSTSPQLGINPASLSFNYDYSATSVLPQTVNISNLGAGTLNWAATPNESWLTLTPGSGTGSGSISVSVNPSGLTVGDYNGSITIRAPGASNSPLTIPVAVSIGYSTPVDTWQIINPYNFDNNALLAIAYGNSTFVTVGIDGTILTSPNGENWTARNSGTTFYLTGVAYGNNVFVTAGTYCGILTSSDNGATWVSRGYGDSYGFNAVAFGGNTFVAVGATHDINGPGVILTSADNGTTWTVRNVPGATEFFDVTYGNDTFIAIDYNYNVYISHDNGITWSTSSFSNFWPYAMTSGNGIFMTFNDYYWWIYTSADLGSTWVPRSYLDYGPGGLAYTDNTFVAAGCLATLGYEGVIYSSADNGVTWVQRNLDPNSYCYYDVVFGNNTFVAVGEGGIIVKSSAGNPAISFTPKSLDLGNINAGYISAPQTVTISNSGYSPLSITQLQIEGSNPLDFSILNDTCTIPPNSTLAPSNTCTLQIAFNPAAGGNKAARLKISSNDPVNPATYIPLSGIGQFALNVTVSTPGSGSVVSAPAGINCESNCTSFFALNSAVGLYATPAGAYTFLGWSGACFGTDKCTVTMNSTVNVTANFSSGSGPISIANPSPSYFATLSDAYNTALSDDIIQATSQTFAEDLNINQDKTVTLQGGFDSSYSTISGTTTLNGTLTISSGTLIIDNLTIQ